MTKTVNKALTQKKNVHRKKNHFVRMLKRILYFKPTSFIGTVIMTALITALVQNALTRPKKDHRFPRDTAGRETVTNSYTAVCTGCGDMANITTKSGNPIGAVCLTCQQNFMLLDAQRQQTGQSRQND